MGLNTQMNIMEEIFNKSIQIIWSDKERKKIEKQYTETQESVGISQNIQNMCNFCPKEENREQRDYLKKEQLKNPKYGKGHVY